MCCLCEHSDFVGSDQTEYMDIAVLLLLTVDVYILCSVFFPCLSYLFEPVGLT